MRMWICVLAACGRASVPVAADGELGEPDAPPVVTNMPIDEPGLPHIDNLSGAPRARVITLVRAAIDGLGFDPAVGQGPNVRDRFFAGRYYLAWIDQTGFHGKLNGLWGLDGAPGDALGFVLTDPDGRPVNTFVPGEDGEGHWAPGYRGAEHIEFPSNVREPNDPASCATGICNWYSTNEAAPISNPKVPWWGACNVGSLPFDSKTDPVSVAELPGGGLKLVYETRLVKQADGDGTYDGDACHADELFPDGVRRPVYIRLGYELWANTRDVDRTMQLRNPAGNPSFTGPMSLIGGFVMTSWPNPYYLKRFNRYWRPEKAPVDLTWGSATVALAAGAWNDTTAQPVLTTDVLTAWIDQPISLSATTDYASGRAITMSHVGPSDNADVGACLCAVHGGLELGGGLIHDRTSLPIAGGEQTIEAKRRLTLPSAPAMAAVGRELSMQQLQHGIGRADGDGWSANTAADTAGHLAYGPYARDWGDRAAQAVFYLMVDNNAADDGVVATLELNDSTANQIVATRPLHRREFRQPMQYQRFTLSADLAGRAGHAMEARVHWEDISYVRLQRVVVNTSPY